MMTSQSPSQIADILWNAKEILRDDYSLNEYRRVILPFVVLRRLDGVMQPYKNVMLKESKKLGKGNEQLLQNRIKDLTGLDFYNTSEYDLHSLIEDPDNIHKNIKEYMRHFSDNIKEIFKKFEFQTFVDKLKVQELLYQTLKYFVNSPLDIDSVDTIKMGTIYEMLIRITSEASNEEAGAHFTPREVIKLMVNLLFENEADVLSNKRLIKRIYDPAVGTGGMLSVAEEYIKGKFSNVTLELFGQEINDLTHSICKSDMLLKDIEHTIAPKNSLNKNDAFSTKKFDYMLSNPPYGVNWKKFGNDIRSEAKMGSKGRYGVGLPRSSDGSLLFLMHMISKMKETETGSRIAVIFNGSPLYTGGASDSKNENTIRQWIIKNNWLEAIVALPRHLFFNTDIQTYIWILTNRKSKKRKGKIQLINAESFFEKLNQNIGKKGREISLSQIKEVTKIYHEFKEGEFSHIFEDDEFGYTVITVERPLKRNFKINKERLERLQETKNFKKLSITKNSRNTPKQEDILKILNNMPATTYKNHAKFSKDLTTIFTDAGFSLNDNMKKLIENGLSQIDETADPEIDINKNVVANPLLRDCERIPLKENIDEFFKENVKKYIHDAWIDESTRDNVGYSILFHRYFFKHTPLSGINEIDSRIEDMKKTLFEEKK